MKAVRIYHQQNTLHFNLEQSGVNTTTQRKRRVNDIHGSDNAQDSAVKTIRFANDDLKVSI